MLRLKNAATYRSLSHPYRWVVADLEPECREASLSCHAASGVCKVPATSGFVAIGAALLRLENDEVRDHVRRQVPNDLGPEHFGCKIAAPGTETICHLSKQGLSGLASKSAS